MESRTDHEFSVADYTVFAGMLCISTSIGLFYAWKVSVSHILSPIPSHSTNRNITSID